jgi:hypothetical protein
MTNEQSRNVVSPYSSSNIVVEWLDRIVCIVGAHEEPHPIGILENRAPDKLVVVTAEAHSSVDPLWHLNIALPLGEELQVQPTS